MKIFYEHGDVVINRNNNTYGIVIEEYKDKKVQILELGEKYVHVNYPPKAALCYCGHTDFKKRLCDVLGNIIYTDHPIE